MASSSYRQESITYLVTCTIMINFIFVPACPNFPFIHDTSKSRQVLLLFTSANKNYIQKQSNWLLEHSHTCKWDRQICLSHRTVTSFSFMCKFQMEGHLHIHAIIAHRSIMLQMYHQVLSKVFPSSTYKTSGVNIKTSRKWYYDYQMLRK